MTEINKGLVHLYVGDGKGKTTAAIGLAVRALGAGKKVLMLQFLKGQQSSELEPLRRLGIVIERTEEIKKFVFQMNEQELAEAAKSCEACIEALRQAFTEDGYDMVVLDEVVDAVNCKLVDTTVLLELLQSRPAGVEIIMTGRNPNDQIVEAADYLTVMTALKHPYQQGVQSRKGIEY